MLMVAVTRSRSCAGDTLVRSTSAQRRRKSAFTRFVIGRRRCFDETLFCFLGAPGTVRGRPWGELGDGVRMPPLSGVSATNRAGDEGALGAGEDIVNAYEIRRI